MNRAITPPAGWQETRDQAIRLYLTLGLIPIPLRGKAPYQTKWNSLEKYQGKSPEEVLSLFQPTDNVGLLLGIHMGQGLFLRGIDYDDLALREEHFPAEAGMPLPKFLDTGVVVRTGSEKFHHYVLSDSPEKFVFQGHNGNEHGGEVQGTGTQLVAPPSLHPETGKPYEFLREDWTSLSFCSDTDLRKIFRPVVTSKKAPPAAPATPNVGARPRFLAADADIVLPSALHAPAGQETIDYDSVDWPDFFRSKGWLREVKKNGTYAVLCPNRAEHSTDTDGTTSSILIPSQSTPGRYRFNCKHGHCEYLRDQDALIEFVGGIDAVLPFCQPYDQQHDTSAGGWSVRDADPGLQERITEQGAQRALEQALAERKRDPKLYASPRQTGQTQNATDPQMMEYLTHPPGNLGALVRWLNASTPQPIPILHVGISLAFAASLLGHGYRWVDGIRPQIYCVGIAQTGAGKEHGRNALIKLANAAGFRKRFVENRMTSLRAMEVHLQERNGRMGWFVDEFGKVINPMLNAKVANASQHLVALQEMLLMVDSQFDGIYSGQGYADNAKTPRVEIMHPILAIYGFSTPRAYFGAINKELIHDGFLNRLLHFRSYDPPPVHRPANFESQLNHPPEHLVELAKGWEQKSICDEYGSMAPFVAEGELEARIAPRTVRASEDAAQVLYDFETRIHDEKQRLERVMDGGSDILVRTAYKAKKVAMILTAADDQREVSPEIMKYACELVWHCEQELIRMIPELDVTNDVKRRRGLSDRILAYVDDAGPLGVTRSQVTKKFQHEDTAQRKALLETLLESQDLVKKLVTDPASGRSSVVYIATRHLEKSAESEPGAS